jgi:predicted nucleotidyltransferase
MLPGDLRADLDRYVERLKSRYGADLVSVVLFGWRARGDAGPESDLDVRIVARGLPRSRWERYEGLRALSGRGLAGIQRRDRPHSGDTR